jgi:hypothetical protein
MILSTSANLWAVAGMVYALAGAALLCIAAGSAPAAAQSVAADDPYARRRLCEQWLDMRIGTLLLAIGFFLQATGSFGTASLNGPAAVVLLGLAFGAAYYGMMKSSLVEDLLSDKTDATRQERTLALVKPVAPAPVVAAPAQVALVEKPEDAARAQNGAS